LIQGGDVKFPKDLKYSEDHLWVRMHGEDKVTVGISDYAQDQLGKVVYLELPEVGDEVRAGEEMGAVESAKSVSDLVSPVSGEVMETNQDLLDDPSPLNEDPYDGGWLAHVRLSDPEEVEELMDIADYRKFIG
jgi:glycine cleavage system H protein